MSHSSKAASKPVLTIGLCFLVALLEGLDLQATGVAAPHMAKEFALTSAMLGWARSLAAGWPTGWAEKRC